MRCLFCRDRVAEVDYKDVARLLPFLTMRNGIRARQAGKRPLCRKHQRQLAVAVKRARFMALLPARTEPREVDWERSGGTRRKPRRGRSA